LLTGLRQVIEQRVQKMIDCIVIVADFGGFTGKFQAQFILSTKGLTLFSSNTKRRTAASASAALAEPAP
jgi:hypothetical protein